MGTELLPLDVSAAKLRSLGPKAIVISGSPKSVYAPDAIKCDPEIFSLGIPVLGICYGMQLVAFSLGGTVGRGAEREDGQEAVDVEVASPLFKYWLIKLGVYLLTRAAAATPTGGCPHRSCCF